MAMMIFHLDDVVLLSHRPGDLQICYNATSIPQKFLQTQSVIVNCLLRPSLDIKKRMTHTIYMLTVSYYYTSKIGDENAVDCHAAH